MIIRNGIPLHLQVENIIREKIITNEWVVGSQIPTEPQLIELFGVSRATLRQSIASLANEGLLERRQGKGTYVRKVTTYDNPTAIITEPSEKTVHSVIAINEKEHVPTICNHLLLPTAEEFTVLTYIHLDPEENRIHNLAFSYMPESKYPDIKRHFFKDTVYAISKSMYGISLGSTLSDIYPVNLTEEQAGHLEVAPGTAAIKIRKIYYDIYDKPAFATEIYSHPFNGKVQVRNAL